MLQQRFAYYVTAVLIVTGLGTVTYVSASAAAPTASVTAVHKMSVHQPSLSAHNVFTNAADGLISTSSPSLAREVFGFALASSLSDPTLGYASWNFSLLSTVAFFGLHINWDGTIVADSGWSVWNSSALTGLLATAHSHGTKVVLTIVLQDFQPGTPNMCAGLINRATTVSRTVAQVKAKGLDGVNVDYEGLNGTCQNGQTSRSMMTAFVGQLRAALPSTSYLSVDTYASSASDPLGFFDIPGLNQHVDAFFVMAYDLEYSNYAHSPLGCSTFCLGPTAPLTGYYYNDTNTVSQYKAVIPASKVILGVPYYGRKACVSAAVANAIPNSSVVADGYVDASGESTAPAVQAGSYALHRDAHDLAGKERWDTWYNTSLGCTRELYWDDTTSLEAKYDLVNTDALRGVGIWTLNYGGGAPELWSALASRFAGCQTVSASASPVSPTEVGTTVTVRAQTTGCSNALYEFWVLPPGGPNYLLAQTYSAASSFAWKAAGIVPGSYRWSIWARNANSAGTFGNNAGRWDAYDNSIVSTMTTCVTLGASVSPASPAAVGTNVTIAAQASGCSKPLYQFWLMRPGTSTYQLSQAYSTARTFSWSTSGFAAGTYRVAIWTRDADSAGAFANNSGRWDAYNNNTVYALTPVCSAVTASVAPVSPAEIGTAVTVTASAAGCNNPVYQFDVLPPGASAYQLAQAYSTNRTLTWKPSGVVPGTYRFSIWARDTNSSGVFGNSAGRWDAYDNNALHTLTSCSSISVSVTPASPARAGTSVTITARASGCSSPLYQFWVLPPRAGASYVLGQTYSTSGTYIWKTTGAATGVYRFSIWARDAASSGGSGNTSGRWDAYNSSTPFTVS
jgi:spore germination protein YaaH